MAKGKTHVFQRILHTAVQVVKTNHVKVKDVLYERTRTCPICSALRKRFGVDVRCALHRIRISKKFPGHLNLR